MKTCQCTSEMEDEMGDQTENHKKSTIVTGNTRPYYCGIYTDTKIDTKGNSNK